MRQLLALFSFRAWGRGGGGERELGLLELRSTAFANATGSSQPPICALPKTRENVVWRQNLTDKTSTQERKHARTYARTSHSDELTDSPSTSPCNTERRITVRSFCSCHGWINHASSSVPSTTTTHIIPIPILPPPPPLLLLQPQPTTTATNNTTNTIL